MHNKDRRRKASDALPPPNRIPVNLAELGIVRIIQYQVASWCPTTDGSGPAEAVVLHLTLETTHGELQFGLRLKTARAVDEMIAALERHRNDVWPGQ